MTSELMTLESRRGRWHRVRQQLHLLEPSSEDFGDGGIASLVADRSVRLLILPADAEAMSIEFDQGFWNWWLEERIDPAGGPTASWGPYKKPTSAAAVSGAVPGVLTEEARRLDAGKTKLAGERAVRKAGTPHLSLRTSSVYGMRGKRLGLPGWREQLGLALDA